MHLKDKTVVVTGGSGGIGTAVCMRLAAEGAGIAVLDRAPPGELEALLAEYPEANLWYRRTDVADPADVRAAFTSLDSEHRTPHVLVNVAGVAGSASFLETTVKQWNDALDVNARGLFFASQEAAKRMRDGGGGRIVNILSTASEQGFAYGSAYCASKGAALLITRTIAIELAEHGIMVNGVGPGTVATPQARAYIARSDVAAHELARTPLSRFGAPEEIAEAVAFLATRASWMTGQVIYVDGGFLATGMPARTQQS